MGHSLLLLYFSFLQPQKLKLSFGRGNHRATGRRQVFQTVIQRLGFSNINKCSLKRRLLSGSQTLSKGEGTHSFPQETPKIGTGKAPAGGESAVLVVQSPAPQLTCPLRVTHLCSGLSMHSLSYTYTHTYAHTNVLASLTLTLWHEDSKKPSFTSL